MLKPPHCDKPSNDWCSRTKYLPKPHRTGSGVAALTCKPFKRNSPGELFSNRIDGKNYLGWILALIHAEKTGNFYWLPLLKKLPPSMAEGFEEVKNIFAEKGLTRCPPITRSDLEDGARSRQQQQQQQQCNKHQLRG